MLDAKRAMQSPRRGCALVARAGCAPGRDGARRHRYLASYRVQRQFHVSPFNDRRGDYEIHCADLQKHLVRAAPPGPRPPS